LVIEPEAPLPDDPDGWTVFVGSELQDLAGNALAGTWSGVAAPYTGTVGASGTAAPVASCSATLSTFRPDGDDGAGAEADRVRLAFSADAAPAWWALEVVDAAGGLQWAEQRPATAASGVWTWDGRDASGAVVPEGVYRLVVDA